MRYLLLLLFSGILFLSLSHFGLISINAAEIHVVDIDAKVIYHYEDDDDEFVGYNERARIQFKDSYFQFNRNYNHRLDNYADRYTGYSLQLDINDNLITRFNQDDLIEVCLNQTSLEIIELKDEEALSDTIQFEYNADLEVFINSSDNKKRYERNRRSFRMYAEFVINGIYDDRFLEYQISQIILIKLKPILYDYFLSYHGIGRVYSWYIYLLTKWI